MVEPLYIVSNYKNPFVYSNEGAEEGLEASSYVDLMQELILVMQL